MSHFTTIKTTFVATGSLLKALADAGFKEVEVHDAAQPLYGYQGDVRADRAEIIIRRRFIGTASNDIGFKRQADGTFTAIISEFDRRRYSVEWLNSLRQRYAYHVVKEQLDQQGFALVEEEVRQDRTIHLVLRRAV